MRDVDEAIRLVPQMGYPLFVRGCCLALKKDYSKAIDAMSVSIRLQPGAPAAYLLRCNLYECIEKDREALKDIEACLGLTPNNPMLITEVAMYLATSNDADLRDGQGAIDAATKACRTTDWKIEWPIAALAAGHAEVGDWKNAIHFQKEAIDKSSEDNRKRQEEILRLYENHQPLRSDLARVKKRLEKNVYSLKPAF